MLQNFLHGNRCIRDSMQQQLTTELSPKFLNAGSRVIMAASSALVEPCADATLIWGDAA